MLDIKKYLCYNIYTIKNTYKKELKSMDTKTKITSLQTRISLLENRKGVSNNAIIAKLKRKIRKLEKEL